ncbi:MAG: nucleotide exchange factor GrpE [Clostridia bacterium]|nr:nucleotide exchange factor GrpE [Clostridia bacterium]
MADEKKKKTEKEEIKENPENKEETLLKENESLKKELEEIKKSAEDFKDKWMRNVAEFDNYKKRNANLYRDAYNDGKIELLLKILPIGDNLSIALNMGLDEKTAEGITLLKRKFDEILKGMEVEEINPEGEKFDPMVCEAIMQVEKQDGEEEDTVKKVFEKGYKLKDKIIRYAKVSVIK